MDHIQTKVAKTGDRLFYSLAQKQSQRKIMFNERLLVLVDEKYLGYIQEYNKKDLETSCDISKLKKKIPLKDIRRILNINKQITLMINQYDKSNKIRSIKWLFRFPTQQLANSWVELLERQNSPFPSRKTTEQKERQYQAPTDKSHKNPSIKDLLNQAQSISKQKQDTKSNRINLIEVKQDKIKSSGSKNIDERESDISKRTFSFRGPGEDDIDNSPPRIQSKIIQPSPILQKFKKAEQNLGKHLEQGVDLRLVQKQLNQIKQQSKKHQRGQFRQLGQNLTNRQKQRLNANFTNYYKQKVGQINDRKFQQFYVFCQIKIQQLLIQDFDDELSTKNWISYVSDKNGVRVQILPTDLKQIPGNSNICDEGLLKSYLNKVKNMDYLWKIISKDQELSSVFKMPMSCMVEFQGILAYFTCNYSVQNESNLSTRNQDFSKYFQKLAQLSKINKIMLQNSSNIKFVKISSQQFLIASVIQFLPRLTSMNCIVRPQIYPQIALQFPSSDSSYMSKTGKKQQQQQNRYFKQPIEQAIQIVSKNLDKLQQYVVHPSQFSKLLHIYGLNIVFLSQIWKRVQNTFMKSIIKTEAAIRSFKVIYRKKMQQLLLIIKQGQNSKEQSRNLASLQRTTKSLLNVLLSKSQQSKLLWDVVTLHSQINFKLPVEINQLNKGYFYLGLQHHLGIRADTKYSGCQKIFTVDAFINDLQFVPKLKPSQLYWLDQQIYSHSLSEAAEELIRQFDLKEKQIPFYIYQNKNTLQKIFEVISMYYGPGASSIKHLKMYDDPDSRNFDLTLHYYRRKITQIKWMIKSQSQIANKITISRIQDKLQKIKQSLSFYFGQFHPFYTQIYDILISLYERQRNYEKVQQLLKISMANIIQLCGGNTMHLRLANNYYQRGQFYQNWSKIQQAIGSYKKAKNILQFNQYTNARQYAMIQLKLAILYLSKYKDGDCYKLLSSCLNTFCKIAKIPINKTKKYPVPISRNPSQIEEQLPQISDDQQLDNYTNIVVCLELINRCAVSDVPDRISTILQTSLTVLMTCIQPQYPMRSVCLPDELTVRLLKLLFQNYFDQYNKQITKQLIEYTQYLCDQNQAGGSHYSDPSNSLTFIKELVINKIYLETLDDFANKALLLNQQRGTNSALKKSFTNRQTDHFNHLLRSLLIVLGEGFVLGVLKEKKI